ncbi:UNVERIFIED_CONTAM: GPR endopeptidase [Halobacillus marinus]|uniref:GPR endopeptidase n=1 Tax=unclassified Halobacillus TaxID=2636472 RepID=UPI0002A52498|nr:MULTISPECIES: GPR endopeptidase [unclassified Halobacillus]ELK45509.1 germination protease [Halobacillus sp. BAB-2008]
MDEQIPYTLRTDLALEAHEMNVDNDPSSTDDDGVQVKEEEADDIKITYVTIDQKGADRIGKKAGHYVTLESLAIRKQDTAMQVRLAKTLSAQIRQLLLECGISEMDRGLIVGLGNHNVTPDALGPLVTEEVLVTSHLFELHPETVSEGYRPVSAVTPGVMGVTGIETSDMVHGIIEEIKPDFVLVIDALASRSINRINATIQLSDTGIHPGSGVGNKRKEISKETYGIPVLSIGVPTVVDAVTITNDTIDYVLKHFGREWKEKDRPSNALSPAMNPFERKSLTDEDHPNEEQSKALLGMFGELEHEEKKQLIKEVLTPLGHNLMVTPKEVDSFIVDMAHVIATGINGALHAGIEDGEAESFSR